MGSLIRDILPHDRIEIVPATRDMVIEYYGEPFPFPVRAWAVYLDVFLTALSGKAFRKNMIEFLRDCKNYDVPKKMVWRVTKVIWKKVMDLNYTNLIAVANPSLPTAPRFLARLGFQHIESSERGEVYLWANL